MTSVDYRWVLDPWTVASHKKALGDSTIPGAPVGVIPWVPLEEQRRIVSYKLYESYYQNAARHWLASNDPKVRSNHREYGDAALIVDQALAALIGTEQSIHVRGAEKHDPTADEDENAAEDPQGAAAVEGTDAGTANTDATNAPGNTVVATDPVAQQAALAAAEREDWLRAWAAPITGERFRSKFYVTELNAMKKGDGVYVLGWDGRLGRPRLKVYEPDVYYPVPDPDSDDDLPSTVHLVWVYREPRLSINDPLVWKLRRISWRLKSVVPWRPRYLNDGDPDSTVSCFMSDGVWTLNDGMSLPETWDLLREDDQVGITWRKGLDEQGNEVDIHDLDIGVDFIPVEHLPNTLNETAPPGARWGQPVIAKVLQVLDDIAATDTDFASATSTTGSPPIALSGVRATKRDADGRITEQGTTTVYGPGQMYHLGENGRMDVLDTSKSLDALTKAKDGLLDRLTHNARMAAIVTGRVDPSKMASGMQLQLSLGPMQSYMAQMRLVRDEAYPRLLGMVQKFAIQNEVIDGPVMDAYVAFGSYLPADRAAAIAAVRELMTPTPVVSRLTCIRILVDAGLPIDDAAAEIKRIEREDFLGAVALGDALGNHGEVAKYLGRVGVEPDPISTTAPTIPVRPDLRGGTAGSRADGQDLLTGSSGRTQPTAPPAPANARR